MKWGCRGIILLPGESLRKGSALSQVIRKVR